MKYTPIVFLFDVYVYTELFIESTFLLCSVCVCTLVCILYSSMLPYDSSCIVIFKIYFFCFLLQFDLLIMVRISGGHADECFCMCVCVYIYVYGCTHIYIYYRILFLNIYAATYALPTKQKRCEFFLVLKLPKSN